MTAARRSPTTTSRTTGKNSTYLLKYDSFYAIEITEIGALVAESRVLSTPIQALDSVDPHDTLDRG